MYEYKARVVKVYDGDTITVNIDLGFGIEFKKQKIRLLGVDTPELRGDEREEGLKIRDLVRDKILDKDVIIKTYKDTKGKYGRWLGEVICEYHKDTVEKTLNEELILLGYEY